MQFIAVLAAVVALSVAGVSADVSTCKPAITGQMSSLYPGGLPTGMLPKLTSLGPMTYKVVSTDEATVGGIKANCIGLTIKDNKVTVGYKMPLLPIISKSFPVAEKPGVLIQTDGQITYYLYMLLVDFINGVVLTYRCCDSCTGTGPNVGIAVADKKVNDPATQAAMTQAMKKMADLGLDKGTTTLQSPCS